MIEVTRLNGSKTFINALLIETIEETPDTIITLTSGKKIIISERAAEAIEKMKDYLRSLGIVHRPWMSMGERSDEG